MRVYEKNLHRKKKGKKENANNVSCENEIPHICRHYYYYYFGFFLLLRFLKPEMDGKTKFWRGKIKNSTLIKKRRENDSKVRIREIHTHILLV